MGAVRYQLERHGRGGVLLEPRQYVWTVNNRPLAANELIQKKLADMQTDIAWVCEARRVSRRLRKRVATPEMISGQKHLARKKR